MDWTWIVEWAVGGAVLVLMSGFRLFRSEKKDDGDSLELRAEITPEFSNSRYKEIYLAGGCFWGMQAYFERIGGVIFTSVGYANGIGRETSYQEIGKTGHAETLYLVYDPDKITLETLLTYFFDVIDPTSVNRQGNDIGLQYRTGIYYMDEADAEVIEKVANQVEQRIEKPIATERAPLKNFVRGEEYHQDYLKKNPGGYCHIPLTHIPNEKPRIKDTAYPKPQDNEIMEKLTKQQYQVTQGKGTERAFENAYWNNKEKGLYVDIVTGEPLFSSEDKFDSGTGWPSFSRPIQWDVLEYQWDHTGGMKRVEVVSRSGKTHLGHVFRDGPRSEGGLRFCMNSSSLRFIPFHELENQGYGAFVSLI